MGSKKNQIVKIISWIFYVTGMSTLPLSAIIGLSYSTAIAIALAVLGAGVIFKMTHVGLNKG